MVLKQGLWNVKVSNFGGLRWKNKYFMAVLSSTIHIWKKWPKSAIFRKNGLKTSSIFLKIYIFNSLVAIKVFEQRRKNSRCGVAIAPKPPKMAKMAQNGHFSFYFIFDWMVLKQGLWDVKVSNMGGKHEKNKHFMVVLSSKFKICEK